MRAAYLKTAPSRPWHANTTSPQRHLHRNSPTSCPSAQPQTRWVLLETGEIFAGRHRLSQDRRETWLG